MKHEELFKERVLQECEVWVAYLSGTSCSLFLLTTSILRFDRSHRLQEQENYISVSDNAAVDTPGIWDTQQEYKNKKPHSNISKLECYPNN